MATKDLYGIGKGSAQVVDLRPVNAMVQQRQAETIMRNQARQKQRATNAAAINSQIDKLKNTAWSRDQQYVSGLMSDTRSWMTDVYSKYGEMALADNPQLKRDFDEKVSFIKRQNDASHANITMGNKMLEQRSHNLDDIDYESAKEFDKWLDLPPAERLSTPMPIIKDRELSILEVMEEEGVKSAIEGTYIETGGTGIKDPETGRYTHYTGNKTDMDAYNSHIDKYSTNKEGRIFRTANRMAMDMIDTNLYPTHIEENGEKIPNPEYQQKLNRVRKQVVDDAASTWKKADEKKSRSYYGSTKGIDKPVSITEVSEDEREHIRKEAPEALKTGKYISGVVENKKTGEKAFKLKSPVYKTIDGKIVENINDAPGGTEISIGTWINKEGNQIEDISEYQEVTKTITSPVKREVGIQQSPKKNITASYYIKNGEKIPIKETDFLENAEIIKYHKASVDKSKKRKFLREGDKGYNRNEAKDVETIIVKTKTGNRYEVEVNDKIKKDFSSVFNKIQESEKEEKSTKTYTIKGKEYSEKDLTDMGYAKDQIKPYLNK